MHTKLSHDLACAEFRSFGRKMPAFYFLMITTMLATAFVYMDAAPLWLSVGIPVSFALLSAVRALWWQRHWSDPVTPAQASRYLRNANVILTVSTLAIVATDCALFFLYGNPSTRFFMIFELMASGMAGFYCLMHLRKSAVLIGIVVITPCLGMLYEINSSAALVAAANIVVTFLVMGVTMKGYHADFATLVTSRAQAAKLAEENLRLANLDMLTGLPNRRRFFEQLQRAIAQAHADGRELAVGIIDLDGFKPVNDTYGHRVGDAVLASIAERLDHASPRIVALCRLGGDEFAFLVRGDVSEEALQDIGAAVIHQVSQPVSALGLTAAVGCSVGYARYPGAALEPDLLYERADYALYEAKRRGRSTVVVFSEEHARSIHQHGLIEQTLRGADFEKELFCEFQPIVNTATGRTWALESLARWNSPALGLVSPGQFIPAAERSGLIAELTPVLLRKALAAAATWEDGQHLSFNISSVDISSAERTVHIARIIRESGVATGRIALEITESALVNSFAHARANIELLRDLGVKISLDDFGTGYSSLGYLHMLPLDKLKIDRVFIDDLQTNPVSRNIVRSVLNLCRDMGLVCITEGVETAGQLGLLRELGGVMVQGYFFSRPMKEEAVIAFLAREKQQRLERDSDVQLAQLLTVCSPQAAFAACEMAPRDVAGQAA
jgi:diguanylate cyclase (GGDEF)-like protein